MVFHFDPVSQVVTMREIPQPFVDQSEAEASHQQQLAAVNDQRRKRPRYGNYELPFPESEEEDQEELQASSKKKRMTPPASEQLSLIHPAIQKEKGRAANQEDD